MTKLLRVTTLLACVGGAVQLAGAPATPAPPLTMATYFGGKWTYQASWSPDGRYIMFLWDDWTRQNIFLIPSGGGTPVRVSDSKSFIGNPSGNSAGEAPSWSPDGKEILYAQDGDLFLTSVPSGQITQLTDTKDTEAGGRFSPDGKKIAYAKGGDMYTLDRATGAVHQLTRDQRGAGGVVWSPDGQWLAFSSGSSTAVSWSPDYSGSRVSYQWRKPGQRDIGVIAASGGPVRWIGASPLGESFQDWAPDSRSILIERRTADVKDRTLFLGAIDGSALRPIYRQHDDKFLPSNDQHALFSPDGGQIAFTSDADGWNHLYVMNSDGSGVRQLTKGHFEVSFPAWTPDGKAVVFCSTEAGTEQRQVYRVTVATGDRTSLTSGPGVNTAAALSRDGKRILYLHTDPAHIPDVWVTSTTDSSAPKRLTDAMTDELHAYHWQTPEIVSFRSQVDGTPIKAQLFVPRNVDKTRKHPAIVHTHQAAIYQEVYLGPGPQKDNVAWYGFNQHLADEGYIVLNVDYRGSYGYGRDFRVGDYMDLGGNDARDVVSGVDYLKSLGYVDANRIGVYGMSYGGHMVLTLLTKYPDLFKAGVDIAGVADFTLNYESLYGPWILGRIGTPDDNPDVYFNDSAINFIDRLKSPLLILHGTNDPNVTLLQSIMLVDQLLKHGKRFEFEIYPGELHFFTKKRSWVDAFFKMDRFFDEYVRHVDSKNGP